MHVCAQPCATLCDPRTITHQAPLSMGFARQEHWSGLPSPPPRDLPNPGIESVSPANPALQADSLPLSQREINISRCTVTMNMFVKVGLWVPYLLTSSDLEFHRFCVVLSSNPALPQYSESLNDFILVKPYLITFVNKKNKGVFGL